MNEEQWVTSPRWVPCYCGRRLQEIRADKVVYAAAHLQDLVSYLSGTDTEHDIFKGAPGAVDAQEVQAGKCTPADQRKHYYELPGPGYQIARGQGKGRRGEAAEP